MLISLFSINSYSVSSCQSLLSFPVNFNIESSLSSQENKDSFFRGIRDGAALLFNKSHIIKSAQVTTRVRNQCEGTCGLASHNTQYEAFLKRQGAIDEGGTLLELAMITVNMFLRTQENPNNTQSYNLERSLSNYSHGRALRIFSYKKPLYLNAATVEQLGGYSKVSQLEASFIKWLRYELKYGQDSYKYLTYFGKDLDTFFTNMKSLWNNFVEEKTGINLGEQDIPDLGDVYSSQISYGLVADQQNLPANHSGYTSVSRSTSLIDSTSHQTDISLILSDNKFYERSHETLPENVVHNTNADLTNNVLKPIVSRLLKGEYVTLSLTWNDSTGFDQSRHAIVLTGVLVNPETKAFEGFVYQNSFSRRYGLAGKGFISKKDFQDSISDISIYFLDQAPSSL